MIKNCLEHDHEWIVKADSHDKKYYECEWCDAEMFEMKTKTDQPECSHEEGSEAIKDELGMYHVASGVCCKCGLSMVDWKKPPQPEIEELDKRDIVKWNVHNSLSTNNYVPMVESLEQAYDKLNEVIRKLNSLKE